MRRLVELCLRHRAAVAILALLALVYGGHSAFHVALDVLPEFVSPQLSIQTEAPGLTPEQVELSVTRAVEAAVNGAPGLASLRSESIAGLSVVNLGFDDDADVQAARQGVAERLAEIGGSLPQGVKSPKLSPLTSATMDLLKIGLVSHTLDPYSLRDLADWTLKPKLLAVPGVARLTVYGGAIRQIQIQPDLERMQAFGLTLADLASAGRAALAFHGAGFIVIGTQQVAIETPTPSFDTGALANAVVAVRPAGVVRLGEVAHVVEGAAVKVGDALIQGEPGVLLSISGQYGANTLAATEAVETALAEMQPMLAARGVEVYPRLHRPANFIERALGELGRALGLGALLILAVLLLFLRDLRSALISFLTIPLSLLIAIAVFDHLGVTLNTMTLGGFAVALGVLVDDAIIDLENILRRLRENQRRAAPIARLEVIRDASLEIRGSVLYATLVVLLVFLPVLLASGIQGRFLRPLALAFIAAVVVSLAVAFTVTPALAALLLPRKLAAERPRWLTSLAAAHARSMALVERRLGLFVAFLVLLLVGAVAWLPYLSGEFLPAFREGHLVIQVSSRAPGTSLDEMLAIGGRISRELLAMPSVATVEQQLGRAELGEDTWGSERSEFHVELRADQKVDEEAVQEEMRRILARYPGLRAEVLTFLGDRISESLTGETAQVVVQLFGDRLDDLERAASGVAATLAGVPGIVDLQLKRSSGTPTVALELDRDALAAYGLTAESALASLASAFGGEKLGQVFEGERSVDVVLILSLGERSRIDALGELMIDGPGARVPLKRLARIAPSQGRATVQHESGRRRVAVTFNVAGRSLQATVAEARQRLAARVHLPSGVDLAFGGEADAERTARRELATDTAVAIALILLVLGLAFRRHRYPWLVLAGLPFCLIGAVFAIGATGVGLSLGALVGLVTVFGVGARNSILLLAHYEHLVDVEGLPWTRETLRRGAAERLVPILMTALVTALGLVPLAMGLNRPGHEIEGPMAVAVLGGLATSTLLNLILLPELVWRFGGRVPGESAPVPPPAP